MTYGDDSNQYLLEIATNWRIPDRIVKEMDETDHRRDTPRNDPSTPLSYIRKCRLM